MNRSAARPLGTAVRLLATAAAAVAFTLGTGHVARAAGPAPVDLGAAAPFVILTKTGITNVPPSDVVGDLGVSPIDSTAITGFSLVLDGTNEFSRSSQVTGKIFAADYAAPTPANLTTAVGDMEAAFADAAGRTLPDYTELYAGNLSGRTLAPGLYTWSTGVLLNRNLTLAGAASDVWIFQIAGNLTVGAGAKVLLSGGAQARNVFWQVAGGAGATIGTTAHVEGTILAAKAIHLRTGATLNGRLLAQTAVTLQKNGITGAIYRVMVFRSDPAADGWVRESRERSGTGGAVNSTGRTLRLGDDARDRQYRSIVSFDTSGLPDGAVIARATLQIRATRRFGGNPFATHGRLRADIAAPYFGATAGLEGSDFEEPAGAQAVAGFGAAHSHWRRARVNAAGCSLVNLTGTTQFRLRFTRGDDDDHAADYIAFASGDASRTSRRPRLRVLYAEP